METKTLISLLKDAEKLLKAVTILSEVYKDVGPYNERPISEESMQKMRAFFKFDDSE